MTMLRPRLTPEEAAERREHIKAVLQRIPPDHEWARCMVEIVQELYDETHAILLAPPSVSPPEDRTYNAGRLAFAEDLLGRLDRWHRAASEPSRGQLSTEQHGSAPR